MLDDAPVEIPCPGCGRKKAQSIAWLRENRVFNCDGCGARIEVDSEKLFSQLDAVLADLKRNFKQR